MKITNRQQEVLMAIRKHIEWDATMEPDLDRIRATIAALDRLTRRKAVAA